MLQLTLLALLKQVKVQLLKRLEALLALSSSYISSQGAAGRELPTDLRGKIHEPRKPKSDNWGLARNNVMTFSGVFAGFCSAVRGFSGVAR
jgi:type II secretory pathway pseudopilin PulG